MREDLLHVDTRNAEKPSQDAVDARRAGDLIAGKYELVRYLARGGMAEVWHGIHADLRTEVAIKFVDGRVSHDRATGAYALERFRFEAQISARLGARTRHVVAVQDAGTHEGVPYLVMEYVPGRTLEQEVETLGPMAPARFADVLDQTADALAVAHGLGIVHRDLKPSNLLLCGAPDGTVVVKVADFGVAKALDATLALDRPRDTQEGQLVGSPAFMSPEQLRGATGIDARSDLWSLGVVAYETLTGKPCFQGSSVLDLFAAICTVNYRRASSLRPDLPPGIDAWIARALAVEPGARFASAAEMAQAFRALLAPSRLARRSLAAVLVVAAAVAFAGAVLVARLRAVPPSTPTAPTTAPAVPPSVARSLAPAPIDSAEHASANRPGDPPTKIDVRDLPSVTQETGKPLARPPQLPVRPAGTTAPAATPPVRPTSKGINPSEIQ
jgi:serine/threonine-protein kinase